MTKYGARRTFSQLCQREFDSKAEAVRGEELRLLEMAGEIEELTYQHRIILSKEPKVTITIDFSYQEKHTPRYKIVGQGLVTYPRIYEDVKGVLTRDFRTKLAWLKQLHGIEVKLIR